MEIYILCFVIGIILYYLINKFCRCNNGFSIGIPFNDECTEEEFSSGKKLDGYFICSQTSTFGEYRYRPIGNPGDKNISDEEITYMAGEKYWLPVPSGWCTLETKYINRELCFDDLRRRVLEQYEIEIEPEIEEEKWKPGGIRIKEMIDERVTELKDQLESETNEEYRKIIRDTILFYTAKEIVEDTGEGAASGGAASEGAASGGAASEGATGKGATVGAPI